MGFASLFSAGRNPANKETPNQKNNMTEAQAIKVSSLLEVGFKVCAEEMGIVWLRKGSLVISVHENGEANYERGGQE